MLDALLRHRRLSASAYLFALIAGVLIPLLLFVALLIGRLAFAERQRIEAEATQLAHHIGLIVDGELEQFVTLLRGLSASSSLVRKDLPRFHAEARRLVAGTNRIVVLRDLGTRQLLNTELAYGAALPPAVPLSERERDAFSAGRPIVSNVYRSPISGEVRVAVALPILEGGTPVQILALTFPTSYLRDALLPAVPPNWIVSVGDREGVIVTRSARHEAVSGNPGLPQYLARAVGRQGVFVADGFDGETLLAGYARSDFSGWLVGANIPLPIVERPLRRSLTLLAALGALVLGLSGIIAFRWGKRFTTGARALAAEAQALGEGRPVAPVRSPLQEFQVISEALKAAGLAVEERVQERERTLEQRRLLINELNHRVKNTLAVVQAIASQTLSGAESPAAARDALASRLAALAGAHDLLTRENWGGARLAEILSTAVAFLGHGERIAARGPAVFLPPSIGVALALVFHELATNAAKYGSLSTAAGRVTVTWEIRSRDHRRELKLTWEERDGPPVSPPTRRGFGSRLIKRSFPDESDASVETDYDPIGVTCRISLLLPDTAPRFGNER